MCPRRNKLQRELLPALKPKLGEEIKWKFMSNFSSLALQFLNFLFRNGRNETRNHIAIWNMIGTWARIYCAAFRTLCSHLKEVDVKCGEETKSSDTCFTLCFSPSIYVRMFDVKGIMSEEAKQTLINGFKSLFFRVAKRFSKISTTLDPRWLQVMSCKELNTLKVSKVFQLIHQVELLMKSDFWSWRHLSTLLWTFPWIWF